MFKPKDIHTFTNYYTLSNNNAPIGCLKAEYSVTAFDNVQLNDFTSVAQPATRSYLVHATQKIMVNGSNQGSLAPIIDQTVYVDYPALLLSSLTLCNSDSSGLNIKLLDYSPKTVNTQIEASGTSANSQDNSSSTSISNTVGSSTSQTNSFGCSVSVGLTELSDSASANYEQSNTISRDQSATTGTGTSQGSSQQFSDADSMSMKDWGSYGYVMPVSQVPYWLFGQEYPWNAINCRQAVSPLNPNTNDPSQVQVNISANMTNRLYDGVCLYPPSQLSSFGIHFVMKAFWLVTLNNDCPDDVNIDYNILYSTASHTLNSANVKNVEVYLQKQPTSISPNSQETLNLPLMALDSIGKSDKIAILGFLPNKFTVSPLPVTAQGGTATPFKIISGANNLYVLDNTTYPANCDIGAGFSTSETSLTATFSSNCSSLSMIVYFKVIDNVNDYTLYMKHWKSQNSNDIKLTFTFNGNQNNKIVKYVDAEEAEGAEKNLLALSLRDQSYASVDYHDYLQLGLNSVQITIESIGAQYSSSDGYQIRSLSIERN